MSRAGKSRLDKTKPNQQQHQQISSTVSQYDIVPGKFNQNHWNLMIEKDENREFVQSIIDELINRLMNEIYDKYLQKQILPFTVMLAKEALLHVVEWQILARDEGEQLTGGVTAADWIPDEELPLAVTDCWAQGAVPVVREFAYPPTMEEEPEIDIINNEILLEKQYKTISFNNSVLPVSYDEDKKSGIQDKSKKKKEDKQVKKKDPGGMQILNVAKDIVPERSLTHRSSALSDMHYSLMKNQWLPVNDDVTFDKFGDVAVVRLDPEKLPTNRVKVDYKLLPLVDSLSGNKKKKDFQADLKRFQRVKNKKITDDKSSENSQECMMETMVDKIDVSPGVLVRAEGKTKKGPPRQVGQLHLSEMQNNLKPISTQSTTPHITVSDILARRTPVLKTVSSSFPLIEPYPPAQPKISS